MSRIYRKFKKPEHEPGVKDGFLVAVGIIGGGLSIFLAAMGLGGLYMWLQSL
jgi:hypothetical protein